MITKKVKIDKPKYIRKYDFLHSLNRPRYLWFVSDESIINIFTGKDEENDELEDDEFDCFDYLRETQMSTNPKKVVDELTEAKLLEGRIIDQKAKEAIIHHYVSQNNSDQEFKIYDFDVIFKDNHSLELQFNYFKELYKKGENAIFFQPVFISEVMGIVAKPDALVYFNGTWDLVEVKGTTTSKKHHLLDMLFQRNAIYRSGIHLNIANYYLCIVAYEKANRNEVTFVLTPNFLPKKSYSDTSEIKKKMALLGKYDEKVIVDKQKEKMGLNKEKMTFKNFLEPTGGNQAINNKIFVDWQIYYYDSIYNKFDQIINDLHQYLEETDEEKEIEIYPSWEYHSFFKDFEYIRRIRAFFGKNGYEQFDFSGFVLCWNYAMLIFQHNLNTENVINILATDKAYLNHYLNDISQASPSVYLGRSAFTQLGCFYNKCLKSKQEVYMNESKAKSLLALMKRNKVYFDFETISMAIRPIDNILPFTQIITQCSIVKDLENDPNDDCLNLIVDPKNITLDFFKEVVDRLYCGEDASYIVYNQGFEKTRLMEMINYLNDDEYTYKIMTIVNNLYDLADFFNLSKEVICIKCLHGNYSIKKILPFILNDHEIVKKTKVIDYETLNVKKGDQCQGITTRRFYDLIDDAKWEEVKVQLQIYCENDVRVMVAIYEFIKKILFKDKKIA